MSSLAIANPLRSVDPGPDASARDAYSELRRYGPEDADTVNDHVRIGIDAAADEDGLLSEVRAVWDGDLSIVWAAGQTAPPDASTPVWLRLELSAPLLGGPRATLAEIGVARVPAFAYYGNVEYATLGDVLGVFTSEEMATFLAVTNPAGKLRVRAGTNIGKLALITLDDGTQGRALDFKLASAINGQPQISPHCFFAQVADLAPDLFLDDADADPDRNVWSVCQPRHVVWLRDEWTRPFGSSRMARGDWNVAVGVDGTVVTTVSSATPGGEAVLAFEASADSAMTAMVTMDYTDAQGTVELLMSAVPADNQATSQLEVALAPPGETMVQALDPRDWFPAQGGRRRDVGASTPVDVVVPAPHAPARYSNGNVITPLIDGAAYFAELDDALGTVTRGDHWALHAGWWLDAEVQLRSHTLHDHWQRILGAGGNVFALAWNPSGGPISAAEAVLPPGPLRDLASEIDDWDEALRQFASLLIAATSDSSAALSPNDDAVELLFQLHGEAILDGRLRPVGSHHAKMAVVRGGAGLIAFVGGIDVNRDRVNSSRHTDYAPGTQPMHDVQCKIEGPAGRDVVRTFISRWNDHPPALGVPDEENGKRSTLACELLEMTGGTNVLDLALDDGDDAVAGTYLAQVARTFGNCRGLKNIPILDEGTFVDDNGYSFAPDGDFTIESAILGAIKRARRYIYIEDQYLGNLKIATAIADRIRERKAEIANGDPDGFFVYIVVTNMSPTTVNVKKYSRLVAMGRYSPPMVVADVVLQGAIGSAFSKLQSSTPDVVETNWVWPYLQSRWVDILEFVDPDHEHWEIFCLCLPPYKVEFEDHGSPGPLLRPTTVDERKVYVHAKIVIVDDIWATIGSANMNVRSYTHDTEINCCFIDGRTDDAGLRVGIRDLRAALWAEHTGFPAGWWTIRDPAFEGSTWRALATTHDPRFAPNTSGTEPVGNRLYLWPESLYVDRITTPTVSWSKNGMPLPLPPTGVMELPIYFWFAEEYGKEPWTPDSTSLLPPPIGGDRFAFDGEDGAEYRLFDLEPIQ